MGGMFRRIFNGRGSLHIDSDADIELEISCLSHGEGSRDVGVA